MGLKSFFMSDYKSKIRTCLYTKGKQNEHFFIKAIFTVVEIIRGRILNVMIVRTVSRSTENIFHVRNEKF